MINHGGNKDWGWKWLWVLQGSVQALAGKECSKTGYLIQAEALYEPFTIQTQIRQVGADGQCFDHGTPVGQFL